MFKLIINNKVNVSVYMTKLSLLLWHDRLTHVSFRSLKYMAKHDLISYKIKDKRTCEICIEPNITRKTFSKVERNINLLELVHFDICELNDILSRRRNIYFITFIDDSSNVYLMKYKDLVFQMFKNYKLEVENQKGKKIQILKSDRGGEYFSMDFYFILWRKWNHTSN